MTSPGFTCPSCGRTSYHPVDLQEGYCGACKDWTGNLAAARLREAVDRLTRDAEPDEFAYFRLFGTWPPHREAQ